MAVGHVVPCATAASAQVPYPHASSAPTSRSEPITMDMIRNCVVLYTSTQIVVGRYRKLQLLRATVCGNTLRGSVQGAHFPWVGLKSVLSTLVDLGDRSSSDPPKQVV